MKISVIGKISAGKSSFINSFISLLNDNILTPVANVSLQRETFNPIEYNIKPGKFEFNSETYNNISNKNRNYRKTKQLPEFKIETQTIKILNPYNIVSITDWPGIDDFNDNRGCFEYFIKSIEKYNIVIFISDATRAFNEKSEREYYELIEKKCRSLTESGKYCKLITLITKFDDIYDTDLNEIYNDIEFYNKYRWSSFNILSKCEIKNNIDKYFQNELSKIKKASGLGDIDNLCNYLKNLVIEKEEYSCFSYYCFNRIDILLTQLTQRHNVEEFKRLVSHLHKYINFDFDNINSKFNEYFFRAGPIYMDVKLFTFDEELFNKSIDIVKYDALKYIVEKYNFNIYIFKLGKFKQIFKDEIVPINKDLKKIFRLLRCAPWRIIEHYHDFKYLNTANGFELLDKFSIKFNKLIEFYYIHLHDKKEFCVLDQSFMN